MPFTAFFLPSGWSPAVQGVFVLGLVSGTMVVMAKRGSHKCQFFVAGVIFVITAFPFAYFCKSAFYWIAWLLGFLAGFAMFGTIAYLPLLVQNLQGGDPFRTGLVMMTM